MAMDSVGSQTQQLWDLVTNEMWVEEELGPTRSLAWILEVGRD